MGIKSSRQLGALYLCLLALSTAGCGSSAKEPEQGLKVEGITAELLGLSIDWEAMDLARENLVSDCMAEAGFEYVPEVHESAGDSPERNSLEFAQEYGLGISSSEASVEVVRLDTDSPNSLTKSRLSPEMLEKWTDTESRCVDQAIEAMDQRRLEIHESLGEEVEEAISNLMFGMGPERMDALGDWSDCMADAGYEFADDLEMYSVLQEEYNSIMDDPDAVEGFRHKEVEIAKANYHCSARFLWPLFQKEYDEVDALVSEQLAIDSLYGEDWLAEVGG